MTAFRVGERVALKSCTDFPGTVKGFGRGKVKVRLTTSGMNRRKRSGLTV